MHSLQRQFTLSPSHNKALAVSDTEQHTGGSQTRTSRTLHWDASGKLQTDGRLHFARDAAGKVSGIQNSASANGSSAAYLTNALGQRIRKHTGENITDTVYGEEAMAPGLQSFALGHYGRRQTAGGASASLSPAGVSEYIYIPTAQGPMPIAAEIDGRLHAVHTDQLNTPRQLTDANGNKVWQWAISGFGEVEATTAQTGWIRERNGSAGARDGTLPISFNLRFPGQQFDEESGLHYNHHRYYDPYLTVGYTEADPIGLNGGWNRFAYAENDPLGAVDPEGLRSILNLRRPNNAMNAAGYHDLRVQFICLNWNCPRTLGVCSRLDDRKPTDFIPFAYSAEKDDTPDGCTCTHLTYKHDWRPPGSDWTTIPEAGNLAAERKPILQRIRDGFRRLPHWHRISLMRGK